MLLQWAEGKPLQLASNTCRARSFLLVGSELWGASGDVSEGHRCPFGRAHFKTMHERHPRAHLGGEKPSGAQQHDLLLPANKCSRNGVRQSPFCSHPIDGSGLPNAFDGKDDRNVASNYLTGFLLMPHISYELYRENLYLYGRKHHGNATEPSDGV